MHSWGLTPPCSYSLFASKQVTPGATAMRTSWSQNHGTVGVSTTAPPLRRAHRPFFTSVVAGGRSTFSIPPGKSTHP